MMIHERILSVLSFFLLVLFSVPSLAQQNLGAITGTVADSTGAVLQKAEVALANNDTGLSKTAASRDDGSFYFTDPEPTRSHLRMAGSRRKCTIRFWYRPTAPPPCRSGFSQAAPIPPSKSRERLC
jgi:hypothetical protein